MTRRVAKWFAVPLTVVTVLLGLGMMTCVFLGIWGDPMLQDKFIATSFALAFMALFTGGAAAQFWIQAEYAND